MPGTGEHGVGIGKKEYLYEELGVGTVELMKTIKRAIDPLGLFNPGKVCRITCSRLLGLTQHDSSFIQMRPSRSLIPQQVLKSNKFIRVLFVPRRSYIFSEFSMTHLKAEST